MRSLVQDAKTSDNEESHSDEDVDDTERPTFKDGFAAIKALKSIFMRNNNDEFLQNLNSMEDKLFNLHINSAVLQKKLLTIFKLVLKSVLINSPSLKFICRSYLSLRMKLSVPFMFNIVIKK